MSGVGTIEPDPPAPHEPAACSHCGRRDHLRAACPHEAFARESFRRETARAVLVALVSAPRSAPGLPHLADSLEFVAEIMAKAAVGTTDALIAELEKPRS